MPSSALLPWVGLPGPHPGFLSFHDERNQRRARGAAPGPCWGLLSSHQKRAPPCAAKIPPEDAAISIPPATSTARVEGRGIKGGYAPFAGGPGTRRFLANLW